MASPSSDDIAIDIPFFIRVYKDGRVERKKPIDFTSPGVDSLTGVTSKDVVISPETCLSVRIYLPPIPDYTKKEDLLPIVFYVHGGGFCIESAFSSTYQTFCNSLSAEARAIVVSADYRLAPEHPLPAAYLDSRAALRWLASQAEAEPWLRQHGDFSRIVLAGDSAGANIVHNLAMAAGGAPAFDAGSEPLRVKLSGVALIHPYFFSPGSGGDRLWELLCPGSPDAEAEPLTNVKATSAPDLSRFGCKRAMVVVAEKDFLRERGRWYHEVLGGSGWNGSIQFVEHQDEFHVFHLFRPESENAKDLLCRLAGFINTPHSNY